MLGLSTAANRMVPPLRHDWVFRLVKRFPLLRFELNGHVQTLHEARKLLGRRLAHCDDAGAVDASISGKGDFSKQSEKFGTSAAESGLYGVMIGRAAYNYPWMFYARCPGSAVICSIGAHKTTNTTPACDANTDSDKVQQSERNWMNPATEVCARIAVAKAYCVYARQVLASADDIVATEAAFANGKYRPDTNTTTYPHWLGVPSGQTTQKQTAVPSICKSESSCSSSTRSPKSTVSAPGAERMVPSFCATGCKPVHSLSELRYRLAQPLFRLLEPPPDSEAGGVSRVEHTPSRSGCTDFNDTNDEHESWKRLIAEGVQLDCADHCKTLRRLRHGLAKHVKAGRFDSFDDKIFESILQVRPCVVWHVFLRLTKLA